MRFLPIENLRTCDHVYAHDGQSHRVLRTISRPHVGVMIGIHLVGKPVLWVTAEHLVLSQRQVQKLTPKGEWSGIPAHHVEYARQLRKESSPPEGILWSRLRGQQLGVKFRRQHQLGPYIADFYCREASLVVEIDGEMHFTPDAIEYDTQRDEWMLALGLRVRRFTSHEVGTNLDGVLEVIWHETRQQVLPDDPGKQWVRADRLQPGKLVFAAQALCETTPLSPPSSGGRPLAPSPFEGRVGVGLIPNAIEQIERIETNEQVYDLEVDGAHSFITETCTVHNCGSGH